MNTPTNPVIAVVDGNATRYPFLAELERQGRAKVKTLTTGRAALRLSRTVDPTFWLVNDQLIDMRGIDCIEMLVELYAEARFFLIADAYDAEQERLCYRFARVKYLCRPLDSQWLSRLLHSMIRQHRAARVDRPPDGATRELQRSLNRASHSDSNRTLPGP